MKTLAALLIAAAVLPARAAPAACNSAPAPASLDGVWVHPAFLAELRRLRSFSAAQAGVDSQVSTVYVRDGQARFNLAWHEDDQSRKCLRLHGEELEVRDADYREAPWHGPYLRTQARGPEDEDAVYLAPWFSGCFRSEARETWCLSPQGITVDGRRIEAVLQKDPGRRPGYGTAFATHLTAHPLTVFLPVAGGWNVFQDDWREDDAPIDPARDPPWRRLRPQ